MRTEIADFHSQTLSQSNLINIHFSYQYNNFIIQPFLDDLKSCVEEVIANPMKAEGNAAIYGMTSSLPPGPVNDLLKIYNDVIFKL